MSLANRSFGHGDLEEREVCQRVGQARIAAIVGEQVLTPHFKMQVALVIAGNQAEACMGKRMAIFAVENADGDGLAVDHGEDLIGAAHLRAKQKRRGG